MTDAKKKVLVIHPGPSFSVADVHDGLVSGLRQRGADVMVLNLDERLTFYMGAHLETDAGEWIPALSEVDAQRLAAKGIEVACYEWWPDVIVVVSGFFIPPEVWGVLARRPHHVVLWCTESPYEDDRQAQPARLADTVILNDPVNLPAMREINPRTFYMPHSFDPSRHHPAEVEKTVDFAFVGTGFYSRIDFFEQVDWTGINAKFGGNWMALEADSPLLPLLAHDQALCMSNAAAADLYRSAKVTANLYRKETSEGGSNEGFAMGPREVELAACGSFFLREPRQEGDELFHMLPTFTTPAEFEDALRWWLAHPVEREMAAAQARGAIANRTFSNTAANLLRLVDGAPTHIR